MTNKDQLFHANIAFVLVVLGVAWAQEEGLEVEIRGLCIYRKV